MYFTRYNTKLVILLCISKVMMLYSKLILNKIKFRFKKILNLKTQIFLFYF